MPRNQLLDEFLIESLEGLSTIADELSAFEKNNQNFELLNSIFRKVHTLKGSTSFLGFKKLQELTHVTETILDLLRNKKLTLTTSIMDTLLKAFDACLEMLKYIDKNEVESNIDYSLIVSELNKILKPENSIAIAVAPIENEVIFQEIPNLKVAAPVVAPRVVAAVPEVRTEVETQSQIQDSVVRVNVSLLDKIMNVVGELVLSRNQILQHATHSNSPELTALAQQLNVITTELQTDVMTTRMQPVGPILTKFERLVRDLSRDVGKKVRLEIVGKDTELDRTLLEAIKDPLTHIIRNSLDHGLEVPSERLKQGKKEEGLILVKAYHESGQITIEIQDDGRGIDKNKILKKAIDNGIITDAQGSQLNEKQILQFIFAPGFSTAEKVTNISGRGVGMDVVKSNVERIGGSVEVNTKVGVGSIFKLKIPLTLAIVPALVVESGGQKFALPQINIVELVRIDETEISEKIEKIQDQEFFRLRGKIIPIYRLSKSLNMPDEKKIDGVNIVFLSAEKKMYGLIVDIILDTVEIVVKPLARNMKSLPQYAGATIMGDGSVSLILDSLGYYFSVDAGKSNKVESLIDEKQTEDTSSVSLSEYILCKLFDLRLYAVPLNLVHRLEEFNVKDIQWSGGLPIVRYREQAMILVEIEKTLNFAGKGEDLTKKDQESKFQAIIIKSNNVYYGLVIHEIFDIAITDQKVDLKIADRKGFEGSVFINNQTVTVLDVMEIMGLQKFSKNEVRA